MINSTLTTAVSGNPINKASSSFVSVKYTAKSSGETSRQTLQVGVPYLSVMEKSLVIAQAVKNNNLLNLSDDLFTEAKTAIVASLDKRINKYKNEPQAVEDTAVYNYESDGIKTHKETSQVYVNGLVIAKKVLVPGDHKVVNSRPLTLAKKKIEKLLPISKYRQFIVSAEHVEKIKGHKTEFVF